jgi:hypothetical protein
MDLIPQLPWPNGILASLALLWFVCVMFSWYVHEFLGLRAPWERRKP